MRLSTCDIERITELHAHTVGKSLREFTRSIPLNAPSLYGGAQEDRIIVHLLSPLSSWSVGEVRSTSKANLISYPTCKGCRHTMYIVGRITKCTRYLVDLNVIVLHTMYPTRSKSTKEESKGNE